ncbi:MAG: O-antigen ligase family protein [Bacteroidia bacterium]|nr:O-antigen ligase family protein [Bacteroidia bacterium]
MESADIKFNPLKILILAMLIWSVPSIFAFEQSLGSLMSYLTYALLLLYFFIAPKRKIIIPFFVLGLLYFIISGLINVDDSEFFIQEFVKYSLLTLCATELILNTNKKELYILLIIGASSIIVQAVFFQSDFGRYSGFYFDPNNAGFVCLFGYCLSFSIPNKTLKSAGQFMLTLAGILTFSRTFLLLWVVVSIISIAANKKNFTNFGIGIGVIVLVLSLTSYLQLNTVRLKAIENLFNPDQTSSALVIQQREGTRTETWSRYYDTILNSPIIGNGFHELRGSGLSKQGVHNTYLMVLGESGIFPFLLIIGIYIYMLIKSLKYFKEEVHLFLLSLSLMAILMTIHTYFDNYVILLISMWLFLNLTMLKSEDVIEQSESVLTS